MEEKALLVSIVVPVYNAETTIAECIQSILEQDYSEMEILLVDDGSRDQSLSVLQGFAGRDNRIKVFTQPNGGVSSARNLALQKASGVYVQFVDSDDVLPPCAVKNMVQAMEAENCDMVIARFHEIIAGKRLLRGYLKENMVLTQAELLEKLSKRPNSFYYSVLWNKLYRRDVIAVNGITCDPSLPWGEDFAFNTRYMRYAARVAVLAESVYDYRRNLDGLAFTTGSRVIFHPIRAMRIKYTLYEYYRKLYEETGLWEQYRNILPRYLFGMTLSD